MKKLYVILLMLMMAFMASAQTFVVISGTVTNINTGAPIVSQAVLVQTDSTGGFLYVNTVYTNPNGYYIDSIPVLNPQLPTVITISTIDCQQYQVAYCITAGIGVNYITQNFVICPPVNNCEADFIYNQGPPLSVQFFNTSTGGSSNLQWNFGDGNLSYLPNPVHTYASAGSYYVTLTTGYPNTNCFDYETKIIQLGDTTSTGCQAYFYAYPDPINPTVVQFENQSIGNIETFTWLFGDGTSTTVTSPGNPNVTHQYNAPGVYNACLTVQGIDSLCYSNFCRLVVIDSIPNVCQASYTYSPMPGAPLNAIQFYNTSISSTQLNYYWNFGDPTSGSNNSSIIADPAHTFPSLPYPAYYQVCLTIMSDDSSCYDTFCQEVVINPANSCSAAFTYAPSPNGSSYITFTDLSIGNIDSWTWQFGDGTAQTIYAPNNPNITHTYQAQGVYTACLFIQTTDSCSSTYCLDVIVGDTLPGCQSYFSYDIISGNNVVQFFDYSTGNPTQWTWDFGDGFTSTEQNPIHEFEISGPYSTFNVCLTILNNTTGCFDTFCKLVILTNNESCLADFTVSPDPGGFPAFYFDDQSVGDIESWTWDFGDGNIVTINAPNSPDVTHSFVNPGYYMVCLVIQGADSCSSTKCSIVAVMDTIWNCQSQFTYYPMDSLNTGTNTFQFLDLSTGNPEQWYWDFGDGTVSFDQNPVHTYASAGTYYVCLTIGGPNCQSVWCSEVEAGPSTNCTSYFTFSNLGMTVNFEGIVVDLTAIATYDWDFGDNQSGTGQNVVHTYANPGIYYVTLVTTSYTGGITCNYTSQQMVTVGDSTIWSQVYGQVYAGNFPMLQGMVMLISVDTTNTFVPFVDIAMIDSSGVYYFPMVPQGNYVIYAIPFEYGYLPTYYGNVLYWQDATVINLGTAANPYNINLIEGDSYVPGNGNIEGEITQGDFSSSLIDKVTMLLKDSQGNVILYSQVDEAGLFEFPQLAYGTYYLYAEMAGCNSQSIMIVIDEATPTATVNLKLSGNNILGRNDQLVLDAGVVYPNPVKETAHIAIRLSKASDLNIEILNMSGQVVDYLNESIGTGENLVSIPVKNLAPGIYSLRIYTSDGLLLNRKLVKTN